MVRPLISFSWALKRVLRSPENFEVLEGFLSELLETQVVILEVLESESGREHREDLFNRVDLKVRLPSGEMIITEVQVANDFDFLQRMLYATSRVVTEHMLRGARYQGVVKVISVNVVYFELGVGDDYVYRGDTAFLGVHRGDQLHPPGGRNVFPTYYLLQINQFQGAPMSKLDEWLYMLKNQDLPAGYTARGLKKAQQVLDVQALSPAERVECDRTEEDERFQAGMRLSRYQEGINEGRELGLKDGVAEGRRAEREVLAVGLLPTHDDWAIVALTKLTAEEVAKLRAAKV